MLYGFLAGVYCTGAAFSLLITGFFYAGRDAWKPIVFALLWPIALPLFLCTDVLD